MNKMRKKGAMRLPKSTTKLKQYFPMIREREDIKREIRENPKLLEKYREWDEEQQEGIFRLLHRGQRRKEKSLQL